MSIDSAGRVQGGNAPGFVTHVVELPDARLELDRLARGESQVRLLLVDGAGRARASSALRALAAAFHARGLEPLLLDLVTEDERPELLTEAGLPLLTRRLLALTQWVAARSEWQTASPVYVGTGAAAAAAIRAAALLGRGLRALVSLAGRPDLALAELPRVASPSLFFLSVDDPTNLELHQLAIDRLASPHRLELLPGAPRKLASEASIQAIAQLASDWLAREVATPATPGAG